MTNVTLTTADKVAALRYVQGQLPAIPGLRGSDHALAMRAWAAQVVTDAIASLSVPLIFRHLGTTGAVDRFEVGVQGECLQLFQTRVRPVWWVWQAIDDAGRYDTLRAVDLVAPDVADANQAARKALREAARDELFRAGLHELGGACRSVKVRGGVIRYDPPAGARRIITR